MSAPGGRQGAALALALLVVIGATLVTTALLHVAGRDLLVAGSASEVVRARAAAESAARGAAAVWRTGHVLDMEPGSVRQVDLSALPGTRPDDRATVRRLDDRLFLIAATATRRGASARAGLLVRALDPVDTWRDLAATLTAAGTVHLGPDAFVSAFDAGIPPAWSPDLCAGVADAAWRAFGAAPRPGLAVGDADDLLPEPGAELVGEPDLLVDPRWIERLTGGPEALRPDLVRSVADRHEHGELRPAPAYAPGACDYAAAGNWGDPLWPAGPCGDYFPLIHSADGLRVLDGAGQGVLVVNGDLRMEAGARFFGLVLVTGDLLIASGAEVHGSVGALGPGPHRIDGTLVRADCVTFRALSNARGLDRAFAPGSRQWLPLF